MGMCSKSEYLNDIRKRYKYATKSQKKIILDEFCATFTYNRKYAIRMLNTKRWLSILPDIRILPLLKFTIMFYQTKPRRRSNGHLVNN